MKILLFVILLFCWVCESHFTALYVLGSEGSGTTWVSRSFEGLSFAQFFKQPFLRDESQRDHLSYEWLNHDAWSGSSSSRWENATDNLYVLPCHLAKLASNGKTLSVHHRSLPDWDGEHYADISPAFLNAFMRCNVRPRFLFVLRNPVFSSFSNYRRCSPNDFFHLHDGDGVCSALKAAKSTELFLSYIADMLQITPQLYWRIIEYESLTHPDVGELLDALGVWLGLSQSNIRRWVATFKSSAKTVHGPPHALSKGQAVQHSKQILHKFFSPWRLSKWDWLRNNALEHDLGMQQESWYCKSTVEPANFRDVKQSLPRSWIGSKPMSVRIIAGNSFASTQLREFLSSYVQVVQNNEKFKCTPCNWDSAELNLLYSKYCKPKKKFLWRAFQSEHRTIFLLQNFSALLCNSDNWDNGEFCQEMIGYCDTTSREALSSGYDMWDYAEWLSGYLYPQCPAGKHFPILGVNSMHPEFGSDSFFTELHYLLQLGALTHHPLQWTGRQKEGEIRNSACPTHYQDLAEALYFNLDSASRCYPLFFWVWKSH